MTQAQVSKFLESNPNRWFTYNYLIKKLKSGCIPANIRRMEKFEEVDVVSLNIKGRRRNIVRYKIEGRNIDEKNIHLPTL